MYLNSLFFPHYYRKFCGVRFKSNSESVKERKDAVGAIEEPTELFEESKEDAPRAKNARTYKRGNDYSSVSPAVIKRLPRYFRYLRDLLHHDILRITIF